MNIVGVDPSSKKVAATITFDETRMEMRYLEFSHDIIEACSEAYDWAFALGGELGPLSFTAIEQPVVGRGGVYSTLRQTKVEGALLAGLKNAGMDTIEVNNQTWKKQVVGNGNAGKPLIALWVKEYWPNAFEYADGDQDLLDSAAINRYAFEVVQRRTYIMNKPTARRFKRRGPR